MKKVLSLFTAVTLLVSMCLPVQASMSVKTLKGEIPKVVSKAEEQSPVIDGEIIVKFKDKVQKDKVNEINKNSKAIVKHHNDRYNLYKLGVPEGTSAKQLIKLYKNLDEVEFAEPNYVVKALSIPNDPDFQFQWGMNNTGQTGGKPDADIDAPEAWSISTASPDVVVAVLDTGVSLRHPDLKDKIWTNDDEIPDNGLDDDNNGYVDDYKGWDFANRENWTDDYNGHGTFCASIAAGGLNNGVGGSGMAGSSKIMPVQVLDQMGSGDYYSVGSGILYAKDNGAKVMSLSLGGQAPSDFLKYAMEQAYNANVTVVCAAGNGYGSPVNYPGAYSEYCLTVGATDDKDELTDFSSTGPEVDVAAPGQDIYGAWRFVDEFQELHRDGYAVISGTSMATPHVAGLAAMVLAKNPGFTSQQVMDQIKYTAEDVNAAKYKGEDIYMGTGRINAYNALTASPKSVLNLEKKQVDDSAGNNNGRLDPGENVNFLVTLKDSWVNASGVTATLTSDDPYVKIVKGTASFGDIPVNGLVTNTNDPLTLTVDPSCPNPHKVSFSVTVNAPGFTDSFPVSIYAGYPSVLFVDDDGGWHDYDLNYKSVLDAKGIPYDVWEVPFNADGPGAVDMSHYKAVIWDALTVNKNMGGATFVGDSLTTADAQALASYLDNGGNLLVVSPNVAASSFLPTEVTNFITNYLHVTSMVSSQANGVSSVPGGIFGAIAPQVESGLVYQMVSDSQAKGIFTVNDSVSSANGSTCGVLYPASGTGTYKSMFLGFELHRLNSQSAMNLIVGQAVDWLLGKNATATANLPPVALAGDNIVYTDDDNNGVERVTVGVPVAGDLTSYDPDGTITAWEWKEGSTILSTNQSFTMRMSEGVHHLTLTVTDNNGAKSSDVLKVHILKTTPDIKDQGPAIPAAPVGPLECPVNTQQFFKVAATDPEGDSVFYGFDWGDGTYSTTENYPSGQEVSIGHVFTKEGKYDVKVRAFDYYGHQYDVTDGWSQAKTVYTDINPPAVATNLMTTLNRFYPWVDLIWDAPTNCQDVNHYHIYRSLTPEINKATDFIKETDLISSYDDTTIGGNTYYYAVTAVDNADLESDLSNVSSITVPLLTPVFEDSFEGATFSSSWTQDSQNLWKISTQNSSQGANSAEVCGPAVNTAITSTLIDLQGKKNAIITFDWTAAGLDAGEYIAFDISTDGGQTWNEMQRVDGGTRIRSWNNVKLDLNEYNLNFASQFQLRFRGTMSDARETANVDNIKVNVW